MKGLEPAPLSVLHDAAFGSEAFGLLHAGSLLRAGLELGNGGARKRIRQLLLVPDVEVGRGGVVVDVARNRHGGLWDQVAAALQEDLGAASVELRVADGGSVEGKNLGASQVGSTF